MAIRLHQFVADFDLPNPSPFCFKVETFLRLAGLDYEIEAWTPNNAPMGKAPVIHLDGEFIADSSVIIERLIDAEDVQLDVQVPADRLAIARSMSRVLEEHTYWALMQSRWIDPKGWSVYSSVIGSSMPVPGLVKTPLLGYLRRNVKKDAHSHGLNRHPPAEIYRRADQDVAGIAAALGTADFMGGEAPCSHDAGVYAFLEHLAHPLVESPLRASIGKRRTLVSYLARMREGVWADGSANFPALPTV